MECPNCRKECKKGFIESRTAGSVTQSLNMVNWYPKDSQGKLIKKNSINLKINSEGHYCDECMKIYAIFEEK